MRPCKRLYLIQVFLKVSSTMYGSGMSVFFLLGGGGGKWKGVVESVARVQRSSGASGFCGRASGIYPSLLAQWES